MESRQRLSNNEDCRLQSSLLPHGETGGKEKLTLLEARKGESTMALLPKLSAAAAGRAGLQPPHLSAPAPWTGDSH